MQLQEFAETVHRTAKEKGWWKQYENGDVMPRPPLEVKMLIVSELAEATEEVRNGKPEVYWMVPTGMIKWDDTGRGANLRSGDKLCKPEGEAVELIDAVIRIMDWFVANKWNLNEHMDDNYHLPVRESALETHMDLVTMVAKATGDDEEKMLGRVVKVIKEYFDLKDWDFKTVLKMKMEYNETRPFRHGGKTA